jgi:uncharacterized protein YjdB
MKKLFLFSLIILSALSSFAIGPISGATSVCQGYTTVLTDPTADGAWSSSNTAVATVGSTGIVRGITAGAVTISYSIGTSYATLSLTVNSTPSAIAGSGGVCLFSEIELTDTTMGGTWTSSNPAVAEVFSGGTLGFVDGMSLGTAVITYALSTGCYAATTVTVAAMPLSIIGPFNLCAGDTIVLADSTHGGTWSSSDVTVATIGSTTGVLIGLTGGFTEISYTTGGGCAAILDEELSDTASIFTFESSEVCVGGELFLDGEPYGGTWSGSGPAATIDSFSGTVTGIAAGTEIITYSLGGRCHTTTAVGVISSLPPITGTPVACASGGGSFLNDSVTGGMWTSSNYSVADVDFGDLDGVSPGTATITYSLGGTCVATIVATVLPNPVIEGPGAICVGTSTTLTDSVAGGTWSSFSTYTATISPSGVLTGVAAGYAYINYTVDFGCSASIEISVIPGVSPISGASEFCLNNANTLIDSSVGGIWTSTNPGIAVIDTTSTFFGFIESGIITGVGVGIDTIIYTFAPGCSATFPIEIFACNNAVNNVPGTNTGVKLYPNPVSQVLYIEADPGQYRSLSIYSGVGQLLITRPLALPQTSVDIAALPDGIYLMSVNGANGNTMLKFVKGE